MCVSMNVCVCACACVRACAWGGCVTSDFMSEETVAGTRPCQGPRANQIISIGGANLLIIPFDVAPNCAAAAWERRWCSSRNSELKCLMQFVDVFRLTLYSDTCFLSVVKILYFNCVFNQCFRVLHAPKDSL